MRPIPALYKPPPRPGWRRIHTATVVAVVLNVVLVFAIAAIAGSFGEKPVYDVFLADVMKSDAEMKMPNAVKHKLTLVPAKHDPNPRGPGNRMEAAPAPAPGNRQEDAPAPPPLHVQAPQIAPDSGPSESIPTIVNRPPPAPGASLQGNPEGVTGGTGPQDSEGSGGTGTGGSGDGGNGGGGNGTLTRLVNRVTCLGCHSLAQPQTGDQSPQPYEIEKLFAAQQWTMGGTPHKLTLLCTINEQGYIIDATVVQSSGRADVDESAIMLIRQSKWMPGMVNGQPRQVQAEMPLEVWY